MEQWRLFLAIDLPEKIKAALLNAQQPLRQAALPLSFVRQEAMHVTLIFLGNVATQHVETIGAAMRHMARPCGLLQLTQIGAFPSFHNPSVLWAGLGGATDHMTSLYSDLSTGLAEQGFAVEQRPFRPHITMARVQRDASRQQRAIVASAAQRVQIEPLCWQPAQLTLYRSELLPGGPRYSALERVSIHDYQ